MSTANLMNTLQIRGCGILSMSESKFRQKEWYSKLTATKPWSVKQAGKLLYPI
jgi:hypothetical protein